MDNNMTYSFSVQGDVLELENLKLSGTTGNIGSYICRFELSEDWNGLYSFAVFIVGETPYLCALNSDNICIMPENVISTPGDVSIGIYGSDLADGNVKRISTNYITIPVYEGAYCKKNMPAIPSADVWEMLARRMIPIIGENGNWHFWSIEKNEYSDSGVCANGGIASVSADSTTTELMPNIFYQFGELDSSVNFKLYEPDINCAYCEYMLEFTIPSEETTVTFPENVKFVNDAKFQAGKKYQCSIVNNIGVLIGVEV